MLFVLLACASVFAVAGCGYALWTDSTPSFENYVSARGQIGRASTTLTLFASSMSTWVLFGPPEAGVWGGVPAVAGYALGCGLPLLLYIPLGRRLRRVMPHGHTLTEYVRHRFGRTMHSFVLVLMLSYLFIALAAQVTGIGFIMQLVGGVPIWATAATVLIGSATYTAVGGLRASIFTDTVQAVLLGPLLLALVGGTMWAVGGGMSSWDRVHAMAPDLLSATYRPGLESGVALVIGIVAASLFNQGTWQRVYAATDARALRTSFGITAALVVPIVACTGWLGIVAVGSGHADPASTALFNMGLTEAPPWIRVGLVILGVTLVMSSTDTTLNAIASLLAVDLKPLLPSTSSHAMLRVARWITVALTVPVFAVAAQGYSVLYLFLIANLVCAAAVVPIFSGLVSTRVTARSALAGTLVGLALGSWWFPPSGTDASLLPAFGLALVSSSVVVLIFRASAPVFRMQTLRDAVQVIE